jgi:hypothetical protein
MKKTVDILVIGTEPPCPRCDLLGLLLQQEAPEGGNWVLRHCAFDAPEAVQLGDALRCRIGTAGHVASAADIHMDWEEVYRLAAGPSGKVALRPADRWSPELDRALEPCRLAAPAAGFLMTPVLVIDGRVVHHGNVPQRESIAALLRKELHGAGF